MDSGILPASSAACATALTCWDAVKGVEEWTFSYANVTGPTAMMLREIGAGNATYIASYEAVLNNLLNKWVVVGLCSTAYEMSRSRRLPPHLGGRAFPVSVNPAGRVHSPMRRCLPDSWRHSRLTSESACLLYSMKWLGSTIILPVHASLTCLSGLSNRPSTLQLQSS